MVECQAICSKILKIDQNNESASVMMADLSFQGVNKLQLQTDISFEERFLY